MRKIWISLLIVLLTFSMTGCLYERHEVELKTQKEALSYAASHFGKAKIVNTEKNEEKNSVIYTMQDHEYGFQYIIKSYALEFGLDGTTTGLFYEETYDDFYKQYRAYLLSQLNADNIYNGTLRHSSPAEMLLAICCKSENDAQKDAERVIEQIKKIDRRKFFIDLHVAICDENGNYFGSCAIRNGTYTNKYEERVEQMTHHFATEVHNTNVDLTGISYLYYERLQYKDVERLDVEWLYGDDKTPDDWTTAYYFEYDSEVYFMLDDIVFIKEAEGIEGSHYSTNYTSYWFTKE